MSPEAVVLILVSAAFHVGWNYLTKLSDNPKAFSLWKGSALIVIAPLVLPALPLSSIPGPVWIYIIASGAIHFLYIYALSNSYETGDISYVYPIVRSAPAFVPFASYAAFGEVVSTRGALGIAIVVVCVFLIQLQPNTASHLRGLWNSLRRRDSVWAFVTLATVVGYTLVDKAGMVALRDVPEIPYGFRAPLFFLLEGSICYLLFWAFAGLRRRLPLATTWRREWRRTLVAAIMMLGSYSLILHVMQTENVSYIVALRQSSVLLAVLAGWFGLKEGSGRLRALAAAAMLVGFALLATAE